MSRTFFAFCGIILSLTLEYFSCTIAAMKQRSVKYYVNQLVKKEGSKKAVADLLGVTVRYVEMMLAGKPPSKPLAKLIRLYAKTR